MLHSWVPTETALGSWLWENGFAFKFSKSLYPGKYLNIEEGLPQYIYGSNYNLLIYPHQFYEAKKVHIRWS